MRVPWCCMSWPASAQMIEPGTLPPGMLLTVVTTVDAATEALIDAGL